MTHTNQLMDIMSLDETIKKKYLKTGIYYSFYELSSFIKEKGISEFLAKSRIIGIVIKQRSLYVIYYTGNKLMAYTKANAAKAENVLRSHFEMSNTHLSIINIFIGNYLLAGEAAGSKLAKAQSLGVTIIDETQLKDM